MEVLRKPIQTPPARPWLPAQCAEYITTLEKSYYALTPNELEKHLTQLTAESKTLHNETSLNLNPATNVMNPKAEALLSSGLGSRPSLGYPGDKYEMGLEAIEKIEVLATQLLCKTFNARYAELRLSSGSLANLYAFMATTLPGDSIIVPPAEIGGHVTHHTVGAAGLYGLRVHYAPIAPANYSIDVAALDVQVQELRPKLITIGGSLNLYPHPVAAIREIADKYNCYVHFDAAHLCGLIAGKAWPQPLAEGAHLLSFSTYKSLAGPPAGALLTNERALAERIDKIAFPGLTANFDVAKTAALAMTLLDWEVYGQSYAKTMVTTAATLAEELEKNGIPVFHPPQKPITRSHQFAVVAQSFKSGHELAKRLRRANILTCGIGLPKALAPPTVDNLNGLRIGTPEIVRWGMQASDMRQIAQFFKQILSANRTPESIAPAVTEFKRQFPTLHFIRT